MDRSRPFGLGRSSRSYLVATVLGVAPVLAGCGRGPEWVVHSQVNPDPFLNQRSFSVVPTDFTGYLVGGKAEAEYLSAKPPETQASYQADKLGIDEVFVNSLSGRAQQSGITVARQAGPSGPPFQIHPVIQWLEPGYYAGISAAPAELRMIVRLTGPDGKVIDEIEVHEKAKGVATGDRLRRAASELGKDVADYLGSRVSGVVIK